MAKSRYAYDEEPPLQSELSFEHGQHRAEVFLANARMEPYPNDEYASFLDVVETPGKAAYQALQGAKDLLANEPAYLERYYAEIRGYLSRFD